MSVVNKNLILEPIARRNRQEAKQSAILRFLQQHIWSSQHILQQVMELESRQSAYKTLSNMRSSGLLISHQYITLGGKVTLWGITAHGQGMAFDVCKEEPVRTYFEPSRVSEQNIKHHLDLQTLRLIVEKIGWTDWIDGNRLGVLDKNAKRPDAIVKDSTGLVVAVECERTFKTTKRYEQILISYLKLLRANKVAKVVWVLPNVDMVKRLRKLITGIKSVKVAGQKIQIDPLKHHINLHFCSYQNWPVYD